MEDEEKKYYAFISYSRHDKAIAFWLQKHLEKFKYTNLSVEEENKPSHPKFIRRIFLDKNELESTEGSFLDEIEKSLRESTYLIALCTKNFAGSIWCNKEIEYFLETHNNDLSKIIPVFVDGNNLEDVMSPKMLETKDIFMSRNLPDMRKTDDETLKQSWENGLFQIISYLLKVPREQVANRFQAERYKVLKNILFGVFFALLGFIFLTLWALHAEQKARVSEQNAIVARDEAKVSEQKAIVARNEAEESEKRAIEAKNEADKARKEAEISEQKAIVARNEAEESEQRAVIARNEAEASEKIAIDQATQTALTFDFLTDVLMSSDVSKQGSKDITILDAMHKALADIDKIEHPKVRANIYGTIGAIFNSYGEYDDAKDLIQKALECFPEDLSQEESLDFNKVLNDMGVICLNQAQYKLALELFNKSLKFQLEKLKADHPSLAITYANIANAESSLGNVKLAIEYLEKAEKIQSKDKSLELASTYNSLGVQYDKLSKYNSSLDFYYKALNVQKSIFNKEQHPSLALTYNNIATVYDSLGDYDKALENFNKSLAIQVKAYGNTHPDIARVYNNIATVYNKKAEYEKSIALYNKAIDMQNFIFKGDHPDIALSYSNLGDVFEKKEDYAQALSYYKKALAIQEKVFSAPNIEIARTYDNLGSVYNKLGKYRSAFENFNKALEIQEIFGYSSMDDMAKTYNNIGSLYFKRDELDKALESYNKALEIQSKIYENDHIQLAITHNNLASVYYQKSDLVNAKKHNAIALEIREGVFKGDHPLIALTYNSLGLVYAGLNEQDNAIKCFFKAIAIQEKFLGKNHSSIAIANKNLASSYFAKSNMKKARQHYNAAISILSMDFEINKLTIASFYNDLGLVCLEDERIDAAYANIQKAYDIQNEFFNGGANPDLALSCNNLAKVYSLKNDYPKALEYLNKALEINEKILHSGHPNISETYYNLGTLYKLMGDNKLALENFEKALDVISKGDGNTLVSNPANESLKARITENIQNLAN